MQSQSSPLTMALLNSQTQPYANMAMYDPSALAGMQRLQLAQGLIGGATDASPAYPMQALSRLGQAIVGALLYKQGNSDLEGLGKQRADEASAALARVAGAGGTEPSMVAQPATQTPTPQQPQQWSGLQDAVHQLESGGSMQPGVTGDGGAAGGVMQVHPAALADVNKLYGTNYTMDQVVNDPNIGKRVGGYYLHMMEQRFPGRPDLALAAYNAGPTATANAVASGAGISGLPASTQQYVQKGMQLAQGGNVATDAIPSPVPGGVVQSQSGGPSPQTQRILAQMQQARTEMARNPYNLPLQKQLEAQVENLKQQLEVGQWQVGPNGVMTNAVTGEQKSAAAPLSHYAQTRPGVFEDTSGVGHPVFEPTQRLSNVPGIGVVQTKIGGGADVVLPQSTSGLAAAKSAEAQGAATGKEAVTTSGKMFDLGREADTAIGNIDYGINQLHQAAQGGLPSGYFAPWMATAAAAGKNLGINLDALGIKPGAVGDIQTAQKTLGVVAGSILQNTIGKDSQITDAKIQHFIHTQPDIAMDPNALDRILTWARSQFTYNRNMAMDAMNHTDPNTGMLPPGWRADFVKRQGAFAPIYDPLSHEMAQPEGQGPAAEPPKAEPAKAAAPAAPNFTEGQTATNPKTGARMVFKGGAWQPL